MGKQIETRLTHSLKELHLPAIRECFPEQSEAARAESLSYEQYLLGLMDVECEARREKRIARFLRDSRLPLEKTLSSFERKRLPQKIDAQLNILLDGSF